MQHRFQLISFLLLLLGFSFIFPACQKDKPLEDPTAMLEFSLDTLSFDTVFADVGSTTLEMKVYNPYKQTLNIEKIELNGPSNFRLNIDGYAQNAISDISIAPQDSFYIFVEVTVDPNNDDNPFVILDSIRFRTNGNEQFVFLEAWGQNANYVGTKAGFSRLACGGSTVLWDDPRPYVIYGILQVDSCGLELAPGTQVYFHGGLVINNVANVVYNDGIMLFGPGASLKAKGTLEDPILFRGDRLEEWYDERPGQWATLWLFPGSSDHEIEYTEIQNSIIGLRVDSAVDLRIKNSIIHNTTSSNLLAIHADIKAENCLFFSSSTDNAVQLEHGGNYNFDFCTLAGYSSPQFIEHKSPALRITDARCYKSNGFFCEDERYNDLNAVFNNCIIYGSRADEINLLNASEGARNFDYSFNNCLIRYDELELTDNFVNCLYNTEPLFVAPADLDYHLDTLSSVEGMAMPINSALDAQPILFDIEGNMRDANTPDIGAYEYQY